MGLGRRNPGVARRPESYYMLLGCVFVVPMIGPFITIMEKKAQLTYDGWTRRVTLPI